MALPICQQPPFPRGWAATPYQQAVQLLGKSSGLGVTFDSSATKPAPTGGQDANAHRRQGTRGRDDNSQPLATPRERGRGPPSGRPVSRHLIRRVGTPLGHLTMFPQLQHLEAPHANMVVAQGLLKTLWRCHQL